MISSGEKNIQSVICSMNQLSIYDTLILSNTPWNSREHAVEYEPTRLPVT